MLSYQHAYHAGNAADVHKHTVLAEIIRLLTEKERGISYLETHAGRGLYDLSSDEAQKTREAALGVEQLDPSPSTAFGHALKLVRKTHGPTAYPGSPLIASCLSRAQDRIVLMERHPQEHQALRRHMRGSGAEVHHRDGYEGARALAPLSPRRGLVLIDPSYEMKSEYAGAGALAIDLHRRWAEAVVLIWYPLLPKEQHKELLTALSPQAETLVDEVRFDVREGHRMNGSGMAILAPPFGTQDALDRAFSSASPVLRRV